ncbi:hypothetical protein EV356DRAFT_158222 [Viridothelium virens]|uniref:Uncharacterized protein n=1 Tax=Viridothelium virens TaxID=1048519 RepID=A0A6A6H9Y9_VIRVR|nr:hypothetical protein EV356DRAFT_158222 [Viridothelium virens]
MRPQFNRPVSKHNPAQTLSLLCPSFSTLGLCACGVLERRRVAYRELCCQLTITHEFMLGRHRMGPSLFICSPHPEIQII